MGVAERGKLRDPRVEGHLLCFGWHYSGCGVKVNRVSLFSQRHVSLVISVLKRRHYMKRQLGELKAQPPGLLLMTVLYLSGGAKAVHIQQNYF